MHAQFYYCDLLHLVMFIILGLSMNPSQVTVFLTLWFRGIVAKERLSSTTTNALIQCSTLTCGDSISVHRTCSLTLSSWSSIGKSIIAETASMISNWLLSFSGWKTPLELQNLVHHILSFSMMYLTQVYNDFTVTISTVYLFVEVSTIFSTPRWLMFDHGVKGGSLI